MRLTISGHHVEVTDGLREHISKKLRRVQRHCDTIDHIEFVLVVERLSTKRKQIFTSPEPTSSPPRHYLTCIRLSTRSLINSTGKSRITNVNNELTKTLNGSSDVCLVGIYFEGRLLPAFLIGLALTCSARLPPGQCEQESKTMRILIVSGTSGSGKSSALNQLEDLGYYCVDNLPSHSLAFLLSISRNSRQPATRV